MLDSPWVGFALGLLLAWLFLQGSRASWRFVEPGAEGSGFVLASLALFARLAIATVILWGYKQIAPVGFRPFALAFAGGFLVLYTVELVRYAGPRRKRRSVADQQ